MTTVAWTLTIYSKFINLGKNIYYFIEIAWQYFTRHMDQVLQQKSVRSRSINSAREPVFCLVSSSILSQ